MLLPRPDVGVCRALGMPHLFWQCSALVPSEASMAIARTLTEAIATSVVAYSLQQVNSYPTAVVTARSCCAPQQSISGVRLFGDGGRLSDAASSPRATGMAIESTGDDWKPVFNILEGTCEVWLVDAQHGQVVPGLKTNEHRICKPFQRSLPW